MIGLITVIDNQEELHPILTINIEIPNIKYPEEVLKDWRKRIEYKKTDEFKKQIQKQKDLINEIRLGRVEIKYIDEGETK
jgi:hypothetical protein